MFETKGALFALPPFLFIACLSNVSMWFFVRQAWENYFNCDSNITIKDLCEDGKNTNKGKVLPGYWKYEDNDIIILTKG